MSAVRKTVLVVDDDQMIGKSFDRVLSGEFNVEKCVNAADALDKMSKKEYDVVFTDIKMPGMSGIELAEQISIKRPWTPVVIITGYGTQDSEDRATAAGVSDFLRKPLTPEMIQQSARSAKPRPVLTVIQGGPKVVEAVPEKQYGRLASIALFMAAPFIGLLYALALPFVGMAMLAYVAYTAFAKTNAYVHAKQVGLFFAAPFIGLAYAMLLPFVGIGMLAWVGGRALINSHQTN
jgi:CheY-like chemotaxis protein